MEQGTFVYPTNPTNECWLRCIRWGLWQLSPPKRMHSVVVCVSLEAVELCVWCVLV